MGYVSLVVQVPGCGPDEAFARIRDFQSWIRYTDTVKQVTVRPATAEPPGDQVVRAQSEWEVVFRAGLMRWTETDTIDPAARTIHFQQTTGDFAAFAGHWRVDDADGGARIEFEGKFDFGMPSIGDWLEPVAEVTMQDNLVQILTGLLGELEPVAARDSA
ncbi:type II toxin-antitoxin system RatA family toxin [Nocardia iowensis]|uniref:SRPBCC family protein n=1 Tax=Nocardia iowensis TaxID=204891 RepID=A0ABX8RFI0_NOCIO|nr:SRPBCC family protein [Nocardia iowensis]QXN88364.1 SRPBCC family protein [Nocardia iowensis]